jgi:hypothetical protein
MIDMRSEHENRLIADLDQNLKPFSFERSDLASFPQSLPVLAVWKRQTWNTNRAVVMIRLEEPGHNPGEYSQSIKFLVGKLIRYLPFLYPLGVQVILIKYSQGITEALDKYLDKIDNQRVNLQSIHVVDLPSRRLFSARTWGQLVTGRFQNAIESGIQTFLNST